MVSIQRPELRWKVAFAREKLSARAALPGAFGYDLSAQALRMARARGSPPRELLALAMPGSWMVNNKAPSTVFQRWLRAPCVEAFGALLEALEGGSERWLDAGESTRNTVTEAVSVLSIEGHGVCAVSKVLALLCPETVPLMDDAALWFMLDSVPEPSSAEAPSGGVGCFVPMLDRFANAVIHNESELIELCREHTEAVIDTAQCLDRLLWFESWGWRVLRAAGPLGVRWCWVKDGAREGIVALPGPQPEVLSARPLTRVSLAEIEDGDWRRAAREALTEAVRDYE